MSNKSKSVASYYCNFCKSYRRFKFSDDDHQRLVQVSNSGLVEYSDIHLCQDGLLSVNQLSVDKDYNIRSYEKMELPEFSQPQAIPKPKSRKTGEIKEIHLTQLPNNIELNMILRDDMIDTEIKIRRFPHLEMIPITTLTSDLGYLLLDIYPTSVAYSVELE